MTKQLMFTKPLVECCRSLRNGISVHLACSLNKDFTKGFLNQVYHFLPVISRVLSKTYDNSPKTRLNAHIPGLKHIY